MSDITFQNEAKYLLRFESKTRVGFMCYILYTDCKHTCYTQHGPLCLFLVLPWWVYQQPCKAIMHYIYCTKKPQEFLNVSTLPCIMCIISQQDISPWPCKRAPCRHGAECIVAIFSKMLYSNIHWAHHQDHICLNNTFGSQSEWTVNFCSIPEFSGLMPNALI